MVQLQLQGHSGKSLCTHVTQQPKLRNSLFGLRMKNSYNMLHLLNKNDPRQAASQKERPEWAIKLMVHRLTDIPGCEPGAMCGIFSVHSRILRSFSLCISMSHVFPSLWGLHMYLQSQRTTMGIASHLFVFFFFKKQKSFIDLEIRYTVVSVSPALRFTSIYHHTWLLTWILGFVLGSSCLYGMLFTD